MTIAKYFVGGELEAFVAASDSSTTWSTTSGIYDADFSRGAVGLPVAGQGRYISAPLTSAQTTFWASFQLYLTTPGGPQTPTITDSTWVSFHDASYTALYRIVGAGGTVSQPVAQFQYWSGSAWVNVGSPQVVPSNARHKWDFQFTIANSGGTLAAYCDGVPMGAALTGDTSFAGSGSIQEIRFYTVGNNTFGHAASPYVSEVMILDVSTLGRRLATLALTGTGATDAWTPSTGATSVATVDEVGTYADTDYASSATANQVYTGVTSDLSLTAQQYAVDSVVIAYRALRGAVGPQNLKGVVRVGGTNYPSSANVATLNTAFGYTWADFDLNPATSAAWTPAEINTAGFETGAKSIT